MSYYSGMNPRKGMRDEVIPDVVPVGIGDIRAQAAAEARARVERLTCAQSTGTVKRQMPTPRSSDHNLGAERVAANLAERERLQASAVERAPCVRCGVRADRHEVHGCRRLVL